MNRAREWYVDLSIGEVSKLIESWIFSERDRAVCHRRFIDGIRLEQLATEFDLSVSQIKRIVDRGRAAIVSHCW